MNQEGLDKLMKELDLTEEEKELLISLFHSRKVKWMERFILSLYFGLYGPAYTLDQIAALYKTKTQRIANIKKTTIVGMKAGLEFEKYFKKADKSKILESNIDFDQLPVNIANRLQENSIKKFKDLVVLQEVDLLRMSGIGHGNLKKIERFLAKYGLHLRMKI